MRPYLYCIESVIFLVTYNNGTKVDLAWKFVTGLRMVSVQAQQKPFSGMWVKSKDKECRNTQTQNLPMYFSQAQQNTVVVLR